MNYRAGPWTAAFIFLFLILVMILLLACGGGQSQASADPKPTATTEPVATGAPTATTPTATATPSIVPSEPVSTSEEAFVKEALMDEAPMSETLAIGGEIFQKTAGGVGCQYCHGADASGGIGPMILGRSASEIAGALDRVEIMSFIFLEPSEIQAVADYLNYLGPPGTTEYGHQSG